MESKLIAAVVAIDEKRALAQIRTEIKAGKDKRDLSNQLNYALQQVAIRYEEGEYYIADLIMSGELVSNLLEELGLDAFKTIHGKGLGKVAVGTVFDDIHDVGKNIFNGMLRAEGFEVVDLGTDVSIEKFIKTIKREKPDILGVSGILTSVVENVKLVITAIEEENLREGLKIILGGSIAGADFARYVGADGYSSDAIEGVNICKRWMTNE